MRKLALLAKACAIREAKARAIQAQRLRACLLRVPLLESSGLTEAESLEQLRFLENDIQMHVLDAHGDPWGIETREDYDDYLQRLSVHRT